MKILLFFLFTFVCFSQNIQKKLEAIRASKPPVIDGVLDDDVWQNAPIATNFVMFEPDNGLPEPLENKTEVKILYDDEAIYIGAYMYDSEPDKIMKEITQRDRFATADHFGIFINGFNDGLQDFRFIVSAAGTQMDAVALENEGEDYSWDAIWMSKVSITDKGWGAEIKIPYAALRFSDAKEQVWGVNFFREFRRLRQRFTWNPVNLQKGGFIRQAGLLTGIRDIKTPVRLFFIPYISTYHSLQANTYSDFQKIGMDIKYGINDSYTLDAILIPDFGQAAFDNVELNLTPFEQEFAENRPFFTEGTDLFNKGNILYTRRIGGAPSTTPKLNINEEVLNYPSTVNMINATKISGRDKDGLGIGFLNAITDKTDVIIENTETGVRRVETVEPLTNYNVTVLDQRFNQNSSVTLINTNVLRSGHFTDANVMGLIADLSTKKNTYNYGGAMKMSSQFGLEQSSGTHWESYFGKTFGKFRYNAFVSSMSKDYEINDLGINFLTNYTESQMNVSYRILNPTWVLNSFNINGYHYTQFNNETNWRQEHSFGINVNSTTTKNDYFGFGGYLAPSKTYDYYEPRTEGRFLIIPENWGNWFSFSSNYNRRFALDLRYSYAKFNQLNRLNQSMTFSPRFRFNDKLNLIYTLRYDKQNADIGWVAFNNSDIILGLRDRDTYTQTLTGKYAINQDMTFNLVVRHYWSIVNNTDYLKLNDDGNFDVATDFNVNRDQNFNLWNFDLSYVWWFTHGSQISFLYRNTGNSFSNDLDYNYARNFRNLFENNLTHTFSLSIRYFLDYNIAKKTLRI